MPASILNRLRAGAVFTTVAVCAAVLLAAAGCAHDEARPSTDPVVTQAQREAEYSDLERSNADNPLRGVGAFLH